MRKVSGLSTLIMLVHFATAQNVGIGTLEPMAQLHIANGSLLINSDTGSTPVGGAGRRLMWIPGKSAFRAGRVTGTQWDDANIGMNSFALGYNARAIGNNSFAAGTTTVATGQYATVFGVNTTAQSYASMVIGQYNETATGSTTDWVQEDPLFVVGNGYIRNNNGIGEIIRSNALTISKNGTVAFADTAEITNKLLNVNTLLQLHKQLLFSPDSIYSCYLQMMSSYSVTSSYVRVIGCIPTHSDTKIQAGKAKGQVLILQCYENSFIIKDDPLISNANLNTASVRFDPGDTMVLIWNGGVWEEICFSKNSN